MATHPRIAVEAQARPDAQGDWFGLKMAVLIAFGFVLTLAWYAAILRAAVWLLSHVGRLIVG